MNASCGCWKCLEARQEPIRFMVLCSTCGNKRCPHAADHDLDCTASNEPGQPGSAYEHGSGAASARRLSMPAPRVHNHPPRRCNERVVDGHLRGECLNDDGSPR